jgi:spermidine/putrescine transport system substrate-binding protein
MKKIPFLGLILAAALAAGSCGKEAEKLNLYNWVTYIPPEVIQTFEKETGIKVNYSEYQNNEEMYSILKSGGVVYDVVIPSDYMVSRLISEGMLEELDFSNIPNYSLIDDNYKNLAYDPDGKYSVAYMTGTVGLIYNSALISDEITSWGALFDSKYADQILMFDNPRDTFGIALKYLGYSQNTTDEGEIRAAYELLLQQKPILQAYVMDQIYEKLEGGEAAIGPYYAGDYLVMAENNEDLVFVRPVEGSNYFVDAMCIPKGAKNKTNAELFINFMCETDVALANMEEILYASANYEAADLFAEELAPDDYEIMFASDETRANCDIFTNLPQETLELYSTLWVELKK